MKLEYQVTSSRFILRCTYEERHFARAFGFVWDQSLSSWVTSDPLRAARLARVADASALTQVRHLVVMGRDYALPSHEGLFPYQAEGVRFILSRSASYLAYDPGLGKTIVAATAAKAFAYSVYICPPFLVETVRREFARWAPQVLTIRWDDPAPKSGQGFVRVIPDTRLQSVSDVVPPPEFLVVDEAHRFKSPDAKRSKALFNLIRRTRRISRSVVTLMSGTPIPNRPAEIFPVVNAVAPAVLDCRDFFTFGRDFCAGYQGAFGWDFSGASNLGGLHKLLTRDLMQVRKKFDVLSELPPKVEGFTVLSKLGLPTEIRKLETKILAEHAPDKTADVVGDEHIATYRRLLGEQKAERAIEMLSDMLETKEPLLVFAIHKDVIRTLSDALYKHKPVVITGETPADRRHSLVEKFQNGDTNLAIGNIQACGVGFTMTRASRVVFVESSWVPAENDQAADRAHRIGQKSTVCVTHLVYEDSLDFTVLQTVLSKRRVTDQILKGTP